MCQTCGTQEPEPEQPCTDNQGEASGTEGSLYLANHSGSGAQNPLQERCHIWECGRVDTDLIICRLCEMLGCKDDCVQSAANGVRVCSACWDDSSRWSAKWEAELSFTRKPRSDPPDVGASCPDWHNQNLTEDHDNEERGADAKGDRQQREPGHEHSTEQWPPMMGRVPKLWKN